MLNSSLHGSMLSHSHCGSQSVGHIVMLTCKGCIPQSQARYQLMLSKDPTVNQTPPPPRCCWQQQSTQHSNTLHTAV